MSDAYRDSLQHGMVAGVRVRGQLTPIKFGAEVGNCILRLFRTGVKVMTMTSPLYCINNQNDFEGWGKDHCIMLHDKLDF